MVDGWEGQRQTLHMHCRQVRCRCAGFRPSRCQPRAPRRSCSLRQRSLFFAIDAFEICVFVLKAIADERETRDRRPRRAARRLRTVDSLARDPPITFPPRGTCRASSSSCAASVFWWAICHDFWSRHQLARARPAAGVKREHSAYRSDWRLTPAAASAEGAVSLAVGLVKLAAVAFMSYATRRCRACSSSTPARAHPVGDAIRGRVQEQPRRAISSKLPLRLRACFVSGSPMS